MLSGYLQRSSVLPTRAASESISNVNISFLHLRIIFDRLLKRVVRRKGPGPGSRAAARAALLLFQVYYDAAGIRVGRSKASH